MSDMAEHLPRQRLFGLDFVDEESVVSIAEALLALQPRCIETGKQWPLVVTPNVDQLVKRHRAIDPVAVLVAERAQFVLADGQPIVWASRLLGRPLRARLPGSTLIAHIWPRILATQRRATVIAGSSTVANLIRQDGPNITVVEAPMLDLSDRVSFEAFTERCAQAAAASRAEFVFVTLGYPKQCNIIEGMVRRWPAGHHSPVFLAVGASFDMYYGLVHRAPIPLQRMGLEWFFRFVQEPRRLFRRYFVDDVAFAPMVIREWRAIRRRSARADRSPERGGVLDSGDGG